MLSLRQFIADSIPYHIQSSPAVIVSLASNGFSNLEWLAVEQSILGTYRSRGEHDTNDLRPSWEDDEDIYTERHSLTTHEASSSATHRAPPHPNGEVSVFDGFSLIPQPPVPLQSVLDYHGVGQMLKDDRTHEDNDGATSTSDNHYLWILRQRGRLGNKPATDAEQLLPALVAPQAVLVWGLGPHSVDACLLGDEKGCNLAVALCPLLDMLKTSTLALPTQAGADRRVLIIACNTSLPRDNTAQVDVCSVLESELKQNDEVAQLIHSFFATVSFVMIEEKNHRKYTALSLSITTAAADTMAPSQDTSSAESHISPTGPIPAPTRGQQGNPLSSFTAISQRFADALTTTERIGGLSRVPVGVLWEGSYGSWGACSAALVSAMGIGGGQAIRAPGAAMQRLGYSAATASGYVSAMLRLQASNNSVVGKPNPSSVPLPAVAPSDGKKDANMPEGVHPLIAIREQFALRDATEALRAAVEASKKALRSNKAESNDDTFQPQVASLAPMISQLFLGNASATTLQSFDAAAKTLQDSLVSELAAAQSVARADRIRVLVNDAAHALLSELENVEEWITQERMCGA